MVDRFSKLKRPCRTQRKRREIPDGRVAGLYLVHQGQLARMSWALRYPLRRARSRKLTIRPLPARSPSRGPAGRATEALGEIAGGERPGGRQTGGQGEGQRPKRRRGRTAITSRRVIALCSRAPFEAQDAQAGAGAEPPARQRWSPQPMARQGASPWSRGPPHVHEPARRDH